MSAPQQDVVSMLKSRDAILFDCDGVLWRGGHALEGAKELIGALRTAGVNVYFVTNNSTKSRIEYLHKIEKVLGIQAEAEEVFCSAYAVAALVKEVAPQTKKAYVVGEGGICEVSDSQQPTIRYMRSSTVVCYQFAHFRN